MMALGFLLVDVWEALRGFGKKLERRLLKLDWGLIYKIWLSMSGK